MLCQECQKRIAKVHFTQIIKNNKVTMYLCENCAREKGSIGFPGQFDAGDFFSGLMGRPVELEEDEIVCSKCKMTYDEFQKVGKLGCDKCYETFEEKLGGLIKRLHGNIEHHGKAPKRSKISSREIETLRVGLAKAIHEENYEMAAELRDKIRLLEAQKR